MFSHDCQILSSNNIVRSFINWGGKVKLEINTDFVNDQSFENNYKTKDSVFYPPKLNMFELIKLDIYIYINLIQFKFCDN